MPSAPGRIKAGEAVFHTNVAVIGHQNVPRMAVCLEHARLQDHAAIRFCHALQQQPLPQLLLPLRQLLRLFLRSQNPQWCNSLTRTWPMQPPSTSVLSSLGREHACMCKL